MFLSQCNLDQLHKADRGAHNYYLEKGVVDSRPDHILNLIHYEIQVELDHPMLLRINRKSATGTVSSIIFLSYPLLPLMYLWLL
ncbi:hypothetical protein Ahy_A03g010360 isoform C [Arachis hypogaea]|uniref:Uncharacterized protein n=1 Tax=Arachis hypogaea TaxID=3818 RepID=A0A445DM20_ARAHY|nr:hypothetical protein Ahy_A03g010360 isoform C [Arachis hypogaea]